MATPSISSRLSELSGILEERGVAHVAAELRNLAEQAMDNRLLTLKEAADFLKIDSGEALDLLRNGDLPYVQIGKHIRINIREVLELKRR